MSRELPPNPSLESLRKQAKQRQRTMPPGKLADAQHLLAREYGYATWAALKSHVVTLGLPPVEALTVNVRDGDALRVENSSKLIRNCGRGSMSRCRTTALARMLCLQRCNEATGPRSMSCCTRAQTSASEPIGGRVASACSMIAIRAWSIFWSSAAR